MVDSKENDKFDLGVRVHALRLKLMGTLLFSVMFFL